MRSSRLALVDLEDAEGGSGQALGDVGLVRETALERKEIFRLAPHLAERRWMVLPFGSRAGLLKFRAAVTAYEKRGTVSREDVHRNWSSKDLEREEPLIDRSRYPYACAYRECMMDDARLVLVNLRAAAASGARLLNQAVGRQNPIRIWGVDALS